MCVRLAVPGMLSGKDYVVMSILCYSLLPYACLTSMQDICCITYLTLAYDGWFAKYRGSVDPSWCALVFKCKTKVCTCIQMQNKSVCIGHPYYKEGYPF